METYVSLGSNFKSSNGIVYFFLHHACVSLQVTTSMVLVACVLFSDRWTKTISVGRWWSLLHDWSRNYQKLSKGTKIGRQDLNYRLIQ